MTLYDLYDYYDIAILVVERSMSCFMWSAALDSSGILKS